jgi:hypothetical protein
MRISNVTRWMIAAAALAVVAGSATAQTYTTEIPMSFRVGNTMMLPGSYQIRIDPRDATKVVYVHNLKTHEMVVTSPGVKEDAPKGWVEHARPALGFECAGRTCALSRMWNGQDRFAYKFSVRRLPAGEESTTAVVLKTGKAD